MNRMTTTPFERHAWVQCRRHLGPLLLLMTLVQPALAQTYRVIDCPFAIHTAARDINNRGDIVGNCLDQDQFHGFLLRNGVYKVLDVPNSTNTLAFGINNRGDVVGQYFDSNDDAHGFLFRKGRFHTIDPPNSSFTMARGIDDRGRIVGWYIGADEVARGFLLDWHGFRDIEFPGAEFTGAFDIGIRGIVGGYYVPGESSEDPAIPHGFLRKNGQFRPIDPPDTTGAFVFGINVLGHMVGNASYDEECPDCFTSAFLLTKHGFEFLAFAHPDGTVASETLAFGINDKGKIVGFFYDEVADANRGFVYSPKRRRHDGS